MECAHWLEIWPPTAVVDPTLPSVCLWVTLGHSKLVGRRELHPVRHQGELLLAVFLTSFKHLGVACYYFISCLHTDKPCQRSLRWFCDLSVLFVESNLGHLLSCLSFAPTSGVSYLSTTRNYIENFFLFFGLWRINRQEPSGFCVLSFHICSVFVEDSNFLSGRNLTRKTFT